MKRILLKATILTFLLALTFLLTAVAARSQAQTAYAPTEQEPTEEVAPIAPVESGRADAITSTIAILETHGTLDCSKRGLSGERGCHQYLDGTWRAYSKEVFGYVPEQTPANAEHVTKMMVQGWLDEGMSPRQIFLIWNQGHPGKCRAGVNKHGVKYDSCAYADKALAILATVKAP